ncbi:hypothetical protein G7Y79_00036g072490 [Physcia stellaris]|nr:hypothetical protein G7Y79_00036g072490 [Physcia stellaris]
MALTKVYVSTLFAYSKAAKQLISEQYARSAPDRAILVDNIISTQFILHFPNHDREALPSFRQLLKLFNDETFEKTKSHMVTNIIRLKDTVPVIDDSDCDLDESPEIPTVALSADEEAVKQWVGSLDTHLVRRISQVTGCSITPKLDSIGLLVKGATTVDTEKALKKLETVASMMNQRKSFPIIHSFPISEGEIDIWLQMMPLKELNDRRLATSLVSPGLAKKLGKQLTVVMIKDGQVFPDLAVSKNKRSFDTESTLWKGIPYKSIGRSNHGSSSNVGDLSTENEPQATTIITAAASTLEGRYRTLSEWIDESVATVPIATDPFVPLPDEVGTKPTVIGDNAKDQTKTPPRKRPVKARKAKGAIAEDAMLKELPIAKPADNDTASVNESSQSSQANYSPEELRTISNTSVGSTGKETYSQASNRNDLIFTSGTYAEDLAQIQVLDAPEIQPPYMPAKSSTSGFTSNSLSFQPVWANARAPQVRVGNLIDVLAPEPSKTEQGKRDKDVHSLRRTMNQRKAPMSNRSAQGENSALKQYGDAAAELLAMTRTTQGHVKIELSIGRLLIDYQSGSPEFKKRFFNVGEWSKVFPKPSTPVRLNTLITERLTSFGSDADFIAQLKLPSGRSIFTPEPYEQTIFYRFNGFDTAREQGSVVIDIYEDKNFQPRSKETLVGALDFHFAKRYWDARISVTIADSVDKEYHELSQHVAANLCVTPAADQSLVDISTKINTNTFTFSSVELHRETRHRSTTYPDLFLNLTELQDMSFELSPTKHGHDCRAWTKPKKELINEGKLWWEVSVASVAAEQTFEENKTLELGETCKWQPEDIVGASIVRQMHYLARDIVTRIDSVGYHNKGPKTGSSKEASETAIANLPYW